MKKCKRCDYKWQPRVKDPKECPGCKSMKWKTKKKKK
jgi:predicted Zn-ribbon and HTH transcriptional regulator